MPEGYKGRWSCFIGNGGVEQRYEQYEAMTRQPLPDLWATESVTPATFSAWQPVTFTVSVHNLGPAAANNFRVEMHTSLSAVIDTWNTGNHFTCNAPRVVPPRPSSSIALAACRPTTRRRSP